MQGVVLIHGGCGLIGRITPDLEAQYLEVLTKSVQAAMAVVKSNGPAVQAVIESIKILEDSPLFNAGRGAVFAENSTNELDAGIMDGFSGATGGVSCVKRIKNPIVGADLVMRLSEHSLLSGDGADDFAIKNGCIPVPPEYFFTENRYKQLSSVLKKGKGAQLDHNVLSDVKGTVGAVILDQHGHLASGASTGGLSGKLAGRVSDSSIAGAGFYANQQVAISCTGNGDHFIRHVAAKQVADMMHFAAMTVDEACKQVVLVDMKNFNAGLIAVDSRGHVSVQFNTDGMFRAQMREQDTTAVVRIFK